MGGRDADGVDDDDDDDDDDDAAAVAEEAEAAPLPPPKAGSGGSSGSGEPRAPTDCGACSSCCWRCCESAPPNGVSGGSIGALAENREAPPAPAPAPAPALATAAPALSVRLGCPRSSPRPPKTLPALVLDWARLGMREPVAPAPPADERTIAVSLRGRAMVGGRQQSGVKNKK